MKKKILLISLMVAMLLCIFAIVASAETTDPYIEFKVKLSGEESYVNAYTPNAVPSDPQFNFSAEFYFDNDLTQVISKDSIVAIDLSNATAKNTSKTIVPYAKMASTPYASCKEIKWFNVSGCCKTIGTVFFQNWTALESFDFGIATEVVDRAFNNTGLKSLVIPSTVTTIKGGAFSGCTSLKTLKFEGSLTSAGASIFYGCTALETVDFGQLTSIADNMFQGCTSLKSVILPSTVKSLTKDPFKGCTGLETVDLGQITSMNYGAFDGCTSLVNLTIPSTLKTMGNTNFQGCTSLKYVKIPNSVTSMGYGTFLNCTALEFAEISNATGVVKDQTFSGCSSLKAISIPEGLTGIEARAFNGCTSLKAVYLPSTLTSIGAKADWGHGSFNNCTNLYFVSEPFEVKDSNGSWLGSSFVMPSEPEVYYMPKNLATTEGNDFAYCEQINKCLVFPTKYTAVSSGSGLFVNVGKNNKKGGVTIVFLGDMEGMRYNPKDSRYKNITFVFANEKDTGIDSLTTWYIDEAHTTANFIAYFCAGKVSYDIGAFKPSSGSYTASETDFTKTTYTEQNQPHFQNPNGATSQDANCLESAMTFKTCFCGTKFDIEADETKPALGHIYDFSTITKMTYADYTKDGVITCGCHREGCEGVKDEVIEGSYLFSYLGYSKNADGDMCVSYTVNKEFVGYYKALKQASFSFGLVGTVIDFDENGMIAGEDTPLAESYAGKITRADLTSYTSLVGYDMIIKGFGAKEEYQALYLAMNLYVIDGDNTYYIWDGAETGTNSVVNYKQYLALPTE